jgi:hypothetical protein
LFFENINQTANNKFINFFFKSKFDYFKKRMTGPPDRAEFSIPDQEKIQVENHTKLQPFTVTLFDNNNIRLAPKNAPVAISVRMRFAWDNIQTEERATSIGAKLPFNGVEQDLEFDEKHDQWYFDDLSIEMKKYPIMSDRPDQFVSFFFSSSHSQAFFLHFDPANTPTHHRSLRQ